jgi:hypothetical protein
MKETHMNIEMNDEIFNRIERKVTGWDARAWEEIKHLFQEYQGSMGPEATKTFKEFAWGIASQNILFELLSEEKESA